MVFDDRIVILTLIAIIYSVAPFLIVVVFNYKMIMHLRYHNRRILHRAEDQTIDARRNSARQGILFSLT